jgi:hypothetical protein
MTTNSTNMLFSAAVSALLPLAALWTLCTATPAHRSVKRVSPPSFSKGHDLSSPRLLHDGGSTYSDIARNNATRPLEDILRDGGMNAVRLRIPVNPADGVYGLQYNLDMALGFLPRVTPSISISTSPTTGQIPISSISRRWGLRPI